MIKMVNIEKIKMINIENIKMINIENIKQKMQIKENDKVKILILLINIKN